MLLARDPVALAGTLGFGPHAALLGIVSAWDGVLGAERELQITVAASTLKKASIHACHLANGDLIFMNRIGHRIWHLPCIQFMCCEHSSVQSCNSADMFETKTHQSAIMIHYAVLIMNYI